MKIQTITFILFVLCSCNNKDAIPIQSTEEKEASIIITPNYELIKPPSTINSLLILFGGFPESAVDIKREFEILELAARNDIAVLLMNFNRKLWLEENEKTKLAKIITESITSNNISTTNIFIGGFSSGGNVSLLVANHLIKSNAQIKPKGVFIIDSPIDLLELYRCSKRNIKRNFSETSVKESQRTISSFDAYFGEPENNIEKYQSLSPYIYSTNNIDNLTYLKDVRIRMYTEPDTLWWKENRMNNYEDINAFYIKKLSLQLKETFNSDHIELIETKNKGKRANGYRHPHSWSIVDKENLINWILKE